MDLSEFKKLLAVCYVSIRQVLGLEKRLSDLEAGGGGPATDHAVLLNKDYAHAGHTGFQPTLSIASGSDINTGTDNAKYVTSKAIADSNLTTIEEVQDNLGGTVGGDGFIRTADSHLTVTYSDAGNTLTLGVVPTLHFAPTGVEFGNATQSYDVSGTTWVAAVAGGTLGGIPDETSGGHHLADCLTAMATSRDGAYLAVREASGAASATNPLTVHFLFSGITHFDSISLRSQYVGSVSHNIDIQLWNFDTSLWDTFADLSGESDYVTRNIVVLSPAAYVDAGVVKLQYIHTSSGLTTHYLLFDYVGLSDGGSGSGGTVLASSVIFTPTGTIAATNVQTAIAEVASDPPIAHAGTHVTGGGDTIADAVPGALSGLMSAADKTKLDGIAAGAEVNVNADWNSVAGDSEILNKPSIPTQYTDEMAQDAVGAMVDGSIVYDDGTPYLRLDGDSDSPGNNKVYGTNAGGTKGWKDDPTTGAGDAVKKTYTQASHGFVAGNVIYRTSGSAWAKAKADDATTQEAVGIVESVDGDDFVLVEAGEITGLSGGTDGSVMFLSAATAGAITTTEPTISKPLGVYTGTTTAIVNIMRGLTAEETNPDTDVVGGRLTYVDTTTLKWAFVNSNQIRVWNNTDGLEAIVECASEPTLSSTANDMNGDAMTYAVVYDVFAKYSTTTAITLEVAPWAVSTAGSSARTAAWVTTTDYDIGDRVSNSGSYYPCLVAHNSGTFATDLAAGKWGPAMTGTGNFLGLDIGDGGYAIYSNTGAWRSYRYLGVIITYNDTGSKFRNTTTCTSIANFYNPSEPQLITYNTTASPWSYSTAAWREKNNTTGSVRAQFVSAISQEIGIGLGGSCYFASSGSGGVIINVSGTDSLTVYYWSNQTSRLSAFAPSGMISIGPGFHYAVEREYVAGGGTGYFYGTDGTYVDRGWVSFKA